MSDIRIKYLSDVQEFDIDIKNWDLEFDDGLESAVLYSLFTDARVSDEELRQGETDKRGFWGDAVDNPEKKISGSKLWLLDRATITEEALEESREFCVEALQWLIDDLVAQDITVETSYDENKFLIIQIDIFRPTGKPVTFKFDNVWKTRGGGISKTYA